MSRSKDKIKEFFSQKGKAEMLLNDESFMNKVSGGMATTETYSDEFKRLGLNLSEDECRQVSQTTTRLLNNPIEKLEDISLIYISGGGIDPRSVSRGTNAAIISGVSGGVGALGCFVAGTVCRWQASKAMQKGDQIKGSKLSKAALGLDVATASCLGLAVGGAVAAKVLHDGETAKYWQEWSKEEASINSFDPLIQEDKDEEILNGE